MFGLDKTLGYSSADLDEAIVDIGKACVFEKVYKNMSPLVEIFNPKGTKYAFLGLGILLAVIWVVAWFALVDNLLLHYSGLMSGVDTTLMLGVFMGIVGVAFFITTLAKDKRGLTYGVYVGLAGMFAAGLLLRQSGLLAVLVAGVSLFGGYNGGTLGELLHQVKSRRRR